MSRTATAARVLPGGSKGVDVMVMLRCRVRWSLVGTSVGVVLLLLAGGSPSATAESVIRPASQATEVATTSDDQALLLAYSPEGTFDDQIRSYVAAGSTDSGDVAEAKDVVAGMLETAQSGENLDLTFTPQSQDADVVQLQQALDYLESTSDRQSAVRDERAITEPEPELEFETPDNYPVRGEAIRDRRAWEFRTIIAAHVCGPGGCGPDTDRITIRWTINPGRSGDRFDFNALYSPKSSPAAFDNIYALGGVYRNFSELETQLLGEGGAQDGTGSGSETIQHPSTEGDIVEQPIRMRARFKPQNQVLYDRAKTGRARCRTGGDRSCVY